MTFEEIREMVNSTITENGQRQITGKALNLALTETLSAIEDYLVNNKPEGGGGVETVHLVDDVDTMEITPEHQAANAAVYAKCAMAVIEGKPLPGIQIDALTLMGSSDMPVTAGDAAVTILSNMTMFIPTDSPLASQVGAGLLIMASMFLTDEIIQALISEDGSVMLVQ